MWSLMFHDVFFFFPFFFFGLDAALVFGSV